MTLSYVEKARDPRERFNLWISSPDRQHSKVICWGSWPEMAELIQVVMSPEHGAVHVLPDGEEPTFCDVSLFDDSDDDSSPD